MKQKNRKKKNELKHIRVVYRPWEKKDDELNCIDCATSCQSACKTSCTVGNIPCEKRR